MYRVSRIHVLSTDPFTETSKNYHWVLIFLKYDTGLFITLLDTSTSYNRINVRLMGRTIIKYLGPSSVF